MCISQYHQNIVPESQWLRVRALEQFFATMTPKVCLHGKQAKEMDALGVYVVKQNRSNHIGLHPVCVPIIAGRFCCILFCSQWEFSLEIQAVLLKESQLWQSHCLVLINP